MPTLHKSFSPASSIGLFDQRLQPHPFSNFVKRFSVLVISLVVISCQSKTVSFDSFTTEAWISDSTTCRDYRNSVIQAMEGEFDKFIGMNETELMIYLGHPEKTLLYTRGQKFFSYKLSCEDSLTRSRSLRVRFSALDYVNEVLILD